MEGYSACSRGNSRGLEKGLLHLQLEVSVNCMLSGGREFEPLDRQPPPKKTIFLIYLLTTFLQEIKCTKASFLLQGLQFSTLAKNLFTDTTEVDIDSK